MRAQQKKLGMFGLAICAAAVGLLIPWAFHMGGRFTPLYWSGTGMLLTSKGNYPLYVLIYPTMERANGLDGWGSLCTSRNTAIPLTVDGRFDGGLWRWSLDGASMELGLLQPLSTRDALFSPNAGGGFDLVGYWRGPELVMGENGEHFKPFPSGFTVKHASVTLKWGTMKDFKDACAKAVIVPAPTDSGN